MSRTTAVAVAAALLASCASPHVRRPLEEEPFVLSPGPPLSMTAPVVLHERPGRTAIERMGPGGRIPLVHATVAGRPTLLLVDTGAFDHLLEGWFARELQDAEASGRSAAVTDHANRRVTMDQWGAMSFAVDGWSPLGPIRPLVTPDLVAGPRALGIGGILSPQRLATGGAVVLDFPAREMVAMDAVAAGERLAAHRSSLGTALPCGSTYVIAATVEGKDARLLVDTGASGTDLRASSPAGQALAGRSAVSRDIYAIGGAVGTRMLGDARVTMGQLSTRLDVPLVEDRARASRCPSDGVVGMDVLAECVLVIEASEMRIACG